jgi:hypothetical protein
MANNTET